LINSKKPYLIEWMLFFKKKSSVYIFFLTFLIFLFLLFLFARFLLFVENREGVVLNDPLMSYFSASDFNIPIFIVIYGSILLGIISMLQHPEKLMFAMQTYIIMLLFRFIAMYLTPLNAPKGIINLRDPLVFALGTGEQVTKDLFFSGHIATLCILSLTAINKILKFVFLIFAVIAAVMILLQKAHYTIDLIMAPVAAYVSFRIEKIIYSKLFSVKP